MQADPSRAVPTDEVLQTVRAHHAKRLKPSVVHKVVFAPEAQADLIELYDYIAEHGSSTRALAYVERIEAKCRGLSAFTECGTCRDDIRPGLRVIGVARRVTIGFHVAAEL